MQYIGPQGVRPQDIRTQDNDVNLSSSITQPKVSPRVVAPHKI